jgi:endonuclease/exonuclease/phosphatase family metal-dependent hydrolase
MSCARGLIRIVFALSLAASSGCVQGGLDDDGVGDSSDDSSDDSGGDGSDTGDDGDDGSDTGDDGDGGDSGDSSDDGDDGDGDSGDGGDSDDGGDGPGIVDPIGTDDAIDIAAWNIENFPADANTPALVAELVTSLAIDLVAVEEIANLEAWDELVERLPNHEGVLSFHEYSPGFFQKVGYLYRADLMEVEPDALLFEDDSFQFPRPPLQVTVTVPGADGGAVEFVAIVLHLKAGINEADRDRRRAAMITLEAHIRGLVDGGADEVIVLGDYNEVLTSSVGREVFAPFLEAPDRYRVQTDALAQSGAFSFVPSGAMLDHIITTTGLDDEVGGSRAVIPRLDLEIAGYVDRVSDHLPVAIGLPILP